MSRMSLNIYEHMSSVAKVYLLKLLRTRQRQMRSMSLQSEVNISLSFQKLNAKWLNIFLLAGYYILAKSIF